LDNEQEFIQNKKNNNNNSKKKGSVMGFNYITLVQSIILFNTKLALQEATPFKDGNLMVHSFLNL
jgi:hypothetical protein